MAPPIQGTIEQDPTKILDTQEKRTPKQLCEARGGFWDEATQTCIIAPKEETAPPKVDPKVPEVGEIEGSDKQVVTLPDGRQFFGLGKEDVAKLVEQQQGVVSGQGEIPEGAVRAGTAQKQADIQFQGQQLGQEVGQFGQLPISPTGLDVGEAATAGVVGAIPRALSLAAGGAALGAIGGTAVLPGIGTAAGAAIGAVGGFVSGLASSMIGNFKSQRTDTTTAQQRVLDEGKQTLMDWVTLARADPANKAYYLAQYNMQAALINQAHRQMKLDTSRDLAKFETALPNLAEFNSFYSEGGERDALDLEMRNALVAPPPAGYDLFELANRRGTNE